MNVFQRGNKFLKKKQNRKLIVIDSNWVPKQKKYIIFLDG